MRVAIVHDHLAQDGGAERVVQVLLSMFPEAPLYTLVYRPGHAHPSFRKHKIHTSFIQRAPGGQRHYQWYLPLMPTAVERFDLRGYDVVISSSASFAKGVITLPQTLHVCYLHSPTRYLWTDTIQYVDELGYPRLFRNLAPLFLSWIRVWDRMAADRVDQFIANSQAVQHRIRKYYRRDSQLIHPPVDLKQFTPSSGPGQYYLTGGRLVPYKRFDLVVQAFSKLGLPLKVFGDGPALDDLRSQAKSNIEFLGRVSPDKLARLYQDAIAFLNPQEEDFGITAVEAMAAGRPVIAYKAGGALETVKPGVSGVFFHDQEWEALADTVIRFRPEQFDRTAIRAWAETFGIERFQKEFRVWLDQAWQAHQRQLP